jgi:hypothetical protein
MVRVHGLALVALGTAQVHAVATPGQCLLQADAKRTSLVFGGKLEVVYANSLVGFAVSKDDVQFGKCSDDDAEGDKWWSDLMSKPELREQWDALLINQEADLGETKVGTKVGAPLSKRVWKMMKKKQMMKKSDLLQETRMGQGAELDEAKVGASHSKRMWTMMRMMKKAMRKSDLMQETRIGQEAELDEAQVGVSRSKRLSTNMMRMAMMKKGLVQLGDECCVPASYGEVTLMGVDQLAEVIGATNVAPIASFLDLGSGVGRLAMHMMLAGYARNVTGVELDAGRHHQSEILAERVFSSGRAPRFLQKNMLEVDKLGATVLYMNQQCFPSPDMHHKLAERILGGHFGDLQVLVINPDMEEIEESGKYIADESYLELPMQHMDNMTFRVYRKVQPDDI